MPFKTRPPQPKTTSVAAIFRLPAHFVTSPMLSPVAAIFPLSVTLVASARGGYKLHAPCSAVKDTHHSTMDMSDALLIIVALGVIFLALNLLILLVTWRKPGSSTTDQENNNSEIDMDRQKYLKFGMSIFLEGLCFYVSMKFISPEYLDVVAFVHYAIGIAIMHFSLVWSNRFGRVWKLSIAAASLIILAAGIVFILVFLQSN